MMNLFLPASTVPPLVASASVSVISCHRQELWKMELQKHRVYFYIQPKFIQQCQQTGWFCSIGQRATLFELYHQSDTGKAMLFVSTSSSVALHVRFPGSTVHSQATNARGSIAALLYMEYLLSVDPHSGENSFVNILWLFIPQLEQYRSAVDIPIGNGSISVCHEEYVLL